MHQPENQDASNWWSGVELSVCGNGTENNTQTFTYTFDGWREMERRKRERETHWIYWIFGTLWFRISIKFINTHSTAYTYKKNKRTNKRVCKFNRVHCQQEKILLLLKFCYVTVKLKTQKIEFLLQKIRSLLVFLSHFIKTDKIPPYFARISLILPGCVA